MDNKENKQKKQKKNSNTSGNIISGLIGLAIGVAGYFAVDYFCSDKKGSSSEPKRQIDQNEYRSSSKVEESNKPQEKNNKTNNLNETDEEIESFLCPISMEIMEDPVITPNGICYDRKSILDWLRNNNYCPLTKTPLDSSQLIPNRNLKETIEKYKSFKNK